MVKHHAAKQMRQHHIHLNIKQNELERFNRKLSKDNKLHKNIFFLGLVILFCNKLYNYRSAKSPAKYQHVTFEN